MKKITKEEFDLMGSPRGSNNPVIRAVLELKTNEGLVVERQDWKPKTDFAAYIGNIKRRHNGMNWTVKKLGDNGWAIKRTA